MNCRFCNTTLTNKFLDLGFAPPSNAYLSEEDLSLPERYYPLKVYVCDNCWLVQTQDFTSSEELFTNEYAYFSSVSSSWLAHAAEYSSYIMERLELNSESFVVEIASNDGYLLRNFVQKGIPCLGIEPTADTARVAVAQGIPVVSEFFGMNLAEKLGEEDKLADLLIGNNVYAHVPDINDFTAGMKKILKPSGTITLEFPHLLNLLRYNQFDTVYHEHFSYLSLYTVSRIFEKHGLKIYNVEKLSTHGGSLRVYGCHDVDDRPVEGSVSEILNLENQTGMRELEIYSSFQKKANSIKNDLLNFLLKAYYKGEKVVGYGAAAKGNTLLNYAGIKPDLLPLIFDAAPSKQGKCMPGSHIPIELPDRIIENNPDWVIIFPWNLSAEILKQQSEIVKSGVKYVVCVPEFAILT